MTTAFWGASWLRDLTHVVPICSASEKRKSHTVYGLAYQADAGGRNLQSYPLTGGRQRAGIEPARLSLDAPGNARTTRRGCPVGAMLPRTVFVPLQHQLRR